MQIFTARHPLSAFRFKGGSNSDSTEQTSSATTEASTTQGSGQGDISVSNGGTVINSLSPQDSGIISSVLSFAGDVVDPIISDLNDAVAGAQQLAENSLNVTSTIASKAIDAGSAATAGANANAAASTSNSQLGYSGILENPIFIVGAVAVVGLLAYLSFRK